MSEPTLFERIISREIPADILHEDDLSIAFNDINPQAPHHILVIPKKVIPRIGEAHDDDRKTLGHLLLVARKLAQDLGFSSTDQGFRLVINNGNDGGESVPHLHVHLLAGRQLKWPPG
ncbi:MAG: histidine triad nucleotide-binding protein [Verrucomicrobiaceae bacterium]|nr:histidine triad nucleotide-binding protein [Verrucomicrobiaceae bacterium]